MFGRGDEDGVESVAHLRVQLAVVEELAHACEGVPPADLHHPFARGGAHARVGIDERDDPFRHDGLDELLETPAAAD